LFTEKNNALKRLLLGLRGYHSVLIVEHAGSGVAMVDEVAPIIAAGKKPAHYHRRIAFVGAGHIQDEIRITGRIRIRIASGD